MSNKSRTYSGMGTTITLAMIVGESAVVGHVGDSRLYHVGGRKSRQVTTDHTLAHELLQTGMCSETDIEETNAQHTLTRSLGQAEALIVDVLSFPLSIGDYLVLCTDGLANCVRTAEEMAVHVYGQPAEISQRLVQFALDDDGSDNVTVLSLRVADHLPDVSVHLPIGDASDSTIISG